jgi:hypothetical protein
MARQLRKKSGTGIYHVMVRGINRQDIFEDEEDYLRESWGQVFDSIITFLAYRRLSREVH